MRSFGFHLLQKYDNLCDNEHNFTKRILNPIENSITEIIRWSSETYVVGKASLFPLWALYG